MNNDDAIAIIGMSCHFPQSPDLASYWKLLKEKKNAVGEIPKERWNPEYFYDPDLGSPGKMSTRWGGFIDYPYAFDFDFFNLHKRQASKWDPQQRWLLESSWEALESAGLTLESIKGLRGGVFAGIGNHDYGMARILDAKQSKDDFSNVDIYTTIGNDLSVAVNRLARFYHLQGPALGFNTDCSSALVATHIACDQLRENKIELALVGGVCFIGAPIETIGLSQAWLISPSNQCKSFDQGADGYVLSEGHGFLVLKKLSDAQRDGHTILATIIGSAVNSDCVHQDVTLPSAESMEDVINQALNQANIAPEQVSYIEGHGVASLKADYAELECLVKVFDTPQRLHPCWIGTAKSNLGHLQWASGISSLVKAVLSMKNQLITPVLNFHKPSFEPLEHSSRLKIVQELTEWCDISQRRIAGVNSFGLGGTNAHILIEDFQAVSQSCFPLPWYVVRLSGHSKKAIRDLAIRYADYIEKHSVDNLHDICYSINVGRNPLPYQLTIAAKKKEGLIERLAAIEEAAVPERTKAPKLAWMFTGQGSQHKGMGQALYDNYPAFKAILDQCEEIARPLLNRSLLDVIFNQEKELNRTLYTQPALFSLEYGLAALWKSWGVHPDFLMGHSLGEYVAACVAGLWSLEDGLKIVIKRAQLIDSLPLGGGMMAVFAPYSSLRQDLLAFAEVVSVASYNAPDQFVISGRKEALEACEKMLMEKEVEYRYLTVSHAFHSQLMEPILDRFEQFLSKMPFNKTNIPIISNVTGLDSTELMQTPNYWKNHIRNPVQFHASIQELLRLDVGCFLEIGPQPILTSLGMACASEEETIQWLYSLKKTSADASQLIETLAELHNCGFNIDWKNFYEPLRCSHDPFLPTYPFQRQRIDEKNIPDLTYETSFSETSIAKEREKLDLPLPQDTKAKTEALKALLRKELTHVLKGNVSVDDDDMLFSKLELDSLMIIDLINRIHLSLPHLDITPTVVLENPTLSRLSEALVNRPTKKTAKPHSFREVELLLGDHLEEELKRYQLKQIQFHSILITGITGFVAPYLVETLAKKNSQLNFYCLVRANDQAEAKARVFRNFREKNISLEGWEARIHPMAGDFSRPKLGLGDEDYEKLSHEIDQVFHVGAQVNFVYSFSDLYQSNVEGTQEIINFCIRQKPKMLHHISTVGVFPLFYHRRLEIEETDELQPSWKVFLGYGQSKYAAEQLIKQAEKKGFRANIYRLGIITGDAHSGLWYAEDALPEIFKGCLELGCIPSDMNISFSATPIDFISEAIASIALDRDVKTQQTYHILNDQQARLDELLLLLAEEYSLTILSKEEWLKNLIKVVEINPKHRLAGLLPFFQGLNQILAENPYSTNFLTQNTYSALSKYPVKCPDLTKEVWKKFFQHLQ